MSMIKIQKLIHDYIKRDDEGNAAGTVRAIDGVDLEVKPGQFIAVLGHNGSGKSTLAKHLNALLFPTEGTVWVDGMDTRRCIWLMEILLLIFFPYILLREACVSINQW